MNGPLVSGRPEADEYASYYATYVDLVSEHDILTALNDQLNTMDSLSRSTPPNQLHVLHPPYTWTLPQVIGHMIDGERIFGCRAARFAAGDKTPLPGFDGDLYVANMDDQASFVELLDELRALRQSNLLLLRRLPRTAWTRRGEADGKSVSVRALAYIIVGHVRHHLNIIEKRLGEKR